MPWNWNDGKQFDLSVEKERKKKNDTYPPKISVSHPQKIYLIEKIYLETDRKPWKKS